MDVLELIDQLEDMIEDCAMIPITGKIMINKNDLLDMLKEIRLKLPDDLKQAQWITEEKQKIIIEAQKQADTIIKEADLKVKREIEHHDITQEATRRAAEIINNAQKDAKEIRLGSKEYADGLLSELEKNLNNTGKIMSQKMQNDTNQMLETIHNDVLQLLNSVEKQVNDNLDEVRKNIKELKKFNG